MTQLYKFQMENDTGATGPCLQPPVTSESKKNQKINRSRQYFAALTVSLGGFSAGTVLAWTSPAIGYLIENESNNTNSTKNNDNLPGFKITTSEEALVGAMLTLGALLSALPSGKFADIFGRKFTLVLLSLFYLASFIVLGCATNLETLVLGRLFGGLALGGSCVVCPMYVGEIADSPVRGILGSMFSVQLGVGILYTNVVGTFINWIGLAVCLSIGPVLFMILLFVLPDTPSHLVAEERYKKAKNSLLFFKQDETLALEALTQLRKQFLEGGEQGSIYDLLVKKCYRKGLIAGIGVLAYQQFCGINVVVFYTLPIFRAAGSNLNPAVAAIITNVISAAAGFMPIFVIEKRSRRYFLSISGISLLTGMIGLGIFFHLKSYNVTFTGLQLLPITSVMIFMAGFAIGLGPVPWILLGELFPTEIRGVASGLVVVVNWLSAFVVTFTYPHIMSSIGNYPTFYLYGAINLLGILFIRFLVPETNLLVIS